VAHRDMSPENLMVHEGNVFIIDMGMSLRIPSLQNMNDDNYYGMQHSHQYLHPHPHQRSLILPQSPCGKWYYLSPEVCLSEQPFDGPAVDLWAAGVILFIMLTGLPPWEEPRMSDENFRLMTNGHLMRLLTERRVGLSVDAMDLLQRMFWYDPADRLSLEQVCAHPWITHEKYNIPS
jgi:serine/threonine protein kinase